MLGGARPLELLHRGASGAAGACNELRVVAPAVLVLSM